MKSFLAVVAFAVLVAAVSGGLSDEQKAKLRKNNQECQAETGVADEKVQKLRKGDFSNDDDDLQQYVFCMFRKSDLITEDGVFQKDVAMSKLPEDANREEVEKAIDACMGERGEKPYNSAWKMAKCYHEKNPNHSYV